MKKIAPRATVKILLTIFPFIFSGLLAQSWQQNDLIFNPSGIPSLSFSQPRFADLDADGDYDMFIGSINDNPFYFENTGSATNPTFQTGNDIFNSVSQLDAEIGVFIDLDNDYDLDFICGGFSGLNYFENIGDSSQVQLNKVNDFFQGISVGSNPVPTLADLDADGDYDLLVGLSEDGSLKYYPNTGSPDSAVFLESNAQIWYDVGLYAYPYFSDLDNDGDFDLLAGIDGNGFNYYKNIGDSAQWQWQQNNSLFANLGQSTYWNSPCLVDLNGDNKKDLIYGTASGPLNYYKNTGSAIAPVWTANTSLFGGVLDVGGASSPFLFDFDYDGDLDLLSGVQFGSAKYYKNIGTSFGPAWQANHSYFNSINHSIYLAVTAGDVNGDSLPDIVAGNLSGQLFFHQNSSSGFNYLSGVFSGVDIGDWSAPKLVDMDADNDFDIVAGNEDGNLFYFENSGTPDSASWTEIPGYFGSIDVGTNCVPAAGDIDGDGDIDIITGDLIGEVQYFRNDSLSWTEEPFVVNGISGGQNAAPTLDDLDGDGDLDLALGNYDGTFNYFENKNATFISEPEVNRLPNEFLLVKVYPNPFNHSTFFYVNSPATGDFTLDIYDVLGRKLISQFIGTKNSEQFKFQLNLSEDCASGLYYYSLKFENNQILKTSNGKLVYLK